MPDSGQFVCLRQHQHRLWLRRTYTYIYINAYDNHEIGYTLICRARSQSLLELYYGIKKAISLSFFRPGFSRPSSLHLPLGFLIFLFLF